MNFLIARQLEGVTHMRVAGAVGRSYKQTIWMRNHRIPGSSRLGQDHFQSIQSGCLLGQLDTRHRGGDKCRGVRALLFLEAIVLDDFGLKEPPVGLVFGIDNYAGFFGLAFFDLSITGTNQSAWGLAEESITMRSRCLADAAKTWQGGNV